MELQEKENIKTNSLEEASNSANKTKRKQVKNACVNCQRACKKCDDCRPCTRCIKYNMVDTCKDSERKERKKGIKRGPYKRKMDLSHVLMPRNYDGSYSNGMMGQSFDGDMSSAPEYAYFVDEPYENEEMHHPARRRSMPMKRTDIGHEQYAHPSPWAFNQSINCPTPYRIVPSIIRHYPIGYNPNEFSFSYNHAMPMMPIASPECVPNINPVFAGSADVKLKTPNGAKEGFSDPFCGHPLSALPRTTSTENVKASPPKTKKASTPVAASGVAAPKPSTKLNVLSQLCSAALTQIGSDDTPPASKPSTPTRELLLPVKALVTPEKEKIECSPEAADTGKEYQEKKFAGEIDQEIAKITSFSDTQGSSNSPEKLISAIPCESTLESSKTQSVL